MTLRRAAQRGCKRREVASWKLESSATNHAPSRRRTSSSVQSLPMLPTETASVPAERSIAVTREVVVVLPLVPVMATQRSGLSRHANSGSPMTSVEQARAAEKNAERSGMPGEATARSKRPRTSSLPSTTRTPLSASERAGSPSPEEAPP